MSKFAFGFWVGLATGLTLAALFGQKPTWDIASTSIPQPGFPVDLSLRGAPTS